MKIIYSQETGEVWAAVQDTGMTPDRILTGRFDDGTQVGYHPSCKPEVHELTPEQEAEYDPEKRYTYADGVLTEITMPTSPEESITEE